MTRREIITRDVIDYGERSTSKDVSVRRITFDSMAEHVEAARAAGGAQENLKSTWHGVDSFEQAADLALNGWHDELSDTLALCEDAISKVEIQHTLQTFMPTFDVQGCDVDVARYLSGEPECMIDYPLTTTVKAGRVITLCASNCYSGSLSPATVIQRGKIVAALAMALSRLGYACEIWSDLTSGRAASIRTLVKDAHDVIDPARILFALAHPAMARVLTFPVMHDDREIMKRVSLGLGPVREPIRDLPEGTIYMQSLKSGSDVPNADAAIMDYLRQLEIVQD